MEAVHPFCLLFTVKEDYAHHNSDQRVIVHLKEYIWDLRGVQGAVLGHILECRGAKIWADLGGIAAKHGTLYSHSCDISIEMPFSSRCYASDRWSHRRVDKGSHCVNRVIVVIVGLLSCLSVSIFLTYHLIIANAATEWSNPSRHASPIKQEDIASLSSFGMDEHWRNFIKRSCQAPGYPRGCCI
ncbi:hypothetical protein F5Y15DRAFT_290456 [Xylariaceae sp. FL0016]|nr:hypothetical protein F5Y15DRAFT_290456 [Xylariaceae sp. FL0016]